MPLLQSLGLAPIDDIEIGGVGGKTSRMPVFVVSLSIFDLPAHEIAVVAHPDEPWILLGRDVLNRHRLVLDGPNSAMEID